MNHSNGYRTAYELSVVYHDFDVSAFDIINIRKMLEIEPPANSMKLSVAQQIQIINKYNELHRKNKNPLPPNRLEAIAIGKNEISS